MQMRPTHAVLAATFAALSLSGCPADLGDERTELAGLTTEWNAKLGKAKTGLSELQGKVTALAGADAAVVAEEKATLDRTVTNAANAVAEAEKTMTTSLAAIEAGLATGKSAQAQVALSSGRSTIEGALSRAQSLVAAGGTALQAVEKRMADQKDAVAKAQAAAEALKKAADEAVKKKGASFAVPGLEFTAEALDAEKSKAALDGLVAFFKSCGDLKADLAVVAAGDAADLGTKRAEALKAALVAAGVDARALGQVSGSVEAEGAQTVTVTVAKPCK